MTLLLTYYLFLLYEYVTKISILSLYLTKLYRYVTLSFASVISHILYSEIRQNFANSVQYTEWNVPWLVSSAQSSSSFDQSDELSTGSPPTTASQPDQLSAEQR